MTKIPAAVLCFALLAADAGPGMPSGTGSPLPDEVERGEARPAGRRDAQTIVRLLEARYHSAATWKATFLERYSESGRELRMESGTVYFSRPGRMRWEYESPEEKLFIADGKTVWFYVPADRSVTRARMKESADWRTPLGLLTGKAKLSRLCERIERADPPTVQADHVVLHCLPRGEPAQALPRQPGHALGPGEGDGSFHEVLFEVDTSRNELVRVLVRQSGGLEIEYRFGNWQQNLRLPEAMFHFQTPAGVTLVEESSFGGPSR